MLISPVARHVNRMFPANQMDSQNIYIAVIDDDESVCRSFSRLLRAAHFQPISYSSAEAFLADTKHPKFDCLVLDVQLWECRGWN